MPKVTLRYQGGYLRESSLSAAEMEKLRPLCEGLTRNAFEGCPAFMCLNSPQGRVLVNLSALTEIELTEE